MVDSDERQRTHSAPGTGNDLFVVDMLGGKRHGFFVEAGALDGVKGSNTLLLEEEYSWSGICVEPDPDLFAKLVRNRRCISESVCLYDRSGVVEFMRGAEGWGGVVEHLAPAKEEMWGRGDRVPARAVTLDALLERHDAPQVVDYLSLDTEGSEYLILKDFPFETFQFRVISIEGRSCNELLMSKGYRLAANPFNTGAPWEQYFLGASA